MKRSFVRLVVSSVLVFWALGFVALFIWARSLPWTEEHARRNGVFLVHEMLAEVPASEREERLRQLRPHFTVELSLLSLDDIERRTGRRLAPGDVAHQQQTGRGHWRFLAFGDGEPALAAGPVVPAIPYGANPMGLVIGLVSLPLIAGLLAIRVQWELAKVERVSQALGEGELSARVDNRRGPSNELATSFNEMAERIERLIRSRDELVQAVSHELGSPLSRLRFHMELLESQAGEQREERLAAMTGELDALDELVAELLGYVQSDDLELDRQPFDPARGLADLAELASLEAPDDRTVEVTLALPEGIRVTADQRHFQRAVENLLRNAVRYARHEVRLELTEEADQVCVAVHDDGPGIPRDVREKVMIPFFRLESHRGRKKGGVGLGLAIVNRIVLRHGGRLAIEDSDLGGAAVVTYWPE